MSRFTNARDAAVSQLLSALVTAGVDWVRRRLGARPDPQPVAPTPDDDQPTERKP